MILYIYFLGFIVNWLFVKLLEVQVIKPSDREEKWDVFKLKLGTSIFSWVGFFAMLVVSIIAWLSNTSIDKDPPKWL